MSALYPSFKQTILSTGLNLLTATVRAQLVSSAYTFSVGHSMFNQVGGRVDSPRTLTGKAVANGIFTAASVNFPALTGATVTGLVIYADSGSETTSPLICYLDQGLNLPIAPDGGNLTWYFETGASGIFAL